MKLYFILMISIAFSKVCLTQEVITTNYGNVKAEKKGNVIKFLGIPFASPPVELFDVTGKSIKLILKE